MEKWKFDLKSTMTTRVHCGNHPNQHQNCISAAIFRDQRVLCRAQLIIVHMPSDFHFVLNNFQSALLRAVGDKRVTYSCSGVVGA